MEKGNRELLLVLFFIILLVTFGTFGYQWIEGWSWFDSFYMTIITITTVGYGEVNTLTTGGRVFSMIILALGIGVVAMSATLLTRFIIEKQFNILFGGNKMDKRLKGIKNHYIVCGFGRTGKSICRNLSELDVPFVVIESDATKLEFASDLNYIAIEGDVTTDTILVSASIESANGLVTCLRSDADNLFVTLAAKELNPSIHIIVRGNSESVEARILRAGADSVVYPLQLGGAQIARSIAEQEGIKKEVKIPFQYNVVMGYNLKLYRHFEETPIKISDLLKEKGAVEAIAIKPEKGFIIDKPSLDILVSNNDTVTLLIKPDDAPEKKQMRWSQDLSVGINEFDEDHKHIIDLMNQLENANHKDSIAISTVFNRLLDYTASHIKHEEGYFKKHPFPDMDAHIEEHQRLIKKVGELNKSKDNLLPENVADFLKSWIKDHILGTDKKYAEYYANQQGKE